MFCKCEEQLQVFVCACAKKEREGNKSVRCEDEDQAVFLLHVDLALWQTPISNRVCVCDSNATSNAPSSCLL